MKIYISYLTVSLDQKYRHALNESFVSISHNAAMSLLTTQLWGFTQRFKWERRDSLASSSRLVAATHRFLKPVCSEVLNV